MNRATSRVELSPTLQKQIQQKNKIEQQGHHFRNEMLDSKYKAEFLKAESHNAISRLILLDDIQRTIDENFLSETIIINKANTLLSKFGYKEIGSTERMDFHQSVVFCTIALHLFESKKISIRTQDHFVDECSNEVSNYEILSKSQREAVQLAKLSREKEMAFEQKLIEKYPKGFRRWSAILCNCAYLPDHLKNVETQRDLFCRYIDAVEFVASSRGVKLEPLVQAEFYSLLRQAQNGEVIVQDNYHLLSLLCAIDDERS